MSTQHTRMRRRIGYAVLITVLGLVLAVLRPSLAARADYGSGALGTYTSSPSVTTGAPLATAGAVLVGDSITNRCWPDLAAWLKANGGPTLAVNYRSGRPAADGLAWLAAQTSRPPLTVLALGANNVMDPPTMTPAIRQALQLVPEPTSLLWVDVEVARTKLDAATQLADQRNSGWINAQLYGSLPPAHVVPWAESLAAAARAGRPGWAYYLDDGVHPTTAARPGKGDGCAFWAAVLGPQIKTRYAVIMGAPR